MGLITRSEIAGTAPHEIIDGEARQVIRAPDQVALHLPIAGPTTRMLAYAIDAIAIALIEVGLLVLLFLSTSMVSKLSMLLQRFASNFPKGPVAPQQAEGIMLALLAIFLVAQFLVEWGYFLFWEMVTGGRSIGKALIGLRVVRDGGFPLSFQESLIRNLLRMVDILPGMYAVGLISMVISKEGKRLGDFAAGTIVVRLDRPEPAAPLIQSEKKVSPSFRFDRTQVEHLGANERALVRQTLRRIESLPSDKAEAILTQAVEALRARMGYERVEPAERKAFLEALLAVMRRE